LNDPILLRQEISYVRKQLSHSRGSFFIQFGCVDVISSFDTKQIKFADFCSSMKSLRINKVQEFIQNTGLRPSFTENMPTSTIITLITKPNQELLDAM